MIVAPRKFAALYTLANISGLAATCFLVGPAAQVKKMADPRRAGASVAYVASLALTLVAALKFRSLILTLVFLVVQLLALVYYSLTYVPGGTGLARGVVGRLIGGE